MRKHYFIGALLLLLSALAPQRGWAQYDPTHIYQIYNPRSAMALQVTGDKANQNQEASLASYTGRANQQWRIIDLGGGFYQLQNRSTGLSLKPGGIGSQVYWAQGFAPVQSSFDGNDDGQKWIIRSPITAGNSGLKTITNFKSGLSLSWQASTFNTSPDPNTTIPTKLGQNVDFGLNFTEWAIIDQSANPAALPKLGTLLIVNRYSGKVLSSISGDNGVSQATHQNLAGQQWNISDYDAAGYLVIRNRLTQHALEMGNGGDLKELGHNANTNPYQGGTNQQWALLDVNDSHRLTVEELVSSSWVPFQLYNRNSGKVLQVAGGGNDLYRETQPANQWESLGHPWQQWYLIYWGANRGPVPAIIVPGTTDEAGPLVIGVYPNPAHDRLTLTGVSPATVTAVSVTDVSGKLAPARYEANGTVDVSRLAAGVYIVNITEGVREHHKKFVKN